MEFSDNGCLSPGIHYMTWEDFYDLFSFSPKRKIFLAGLEHAIDILRQCGCTVIYIDGSFVTEKLEPNDYDACWDGDWDIVSKNMLKLEPIFVDPIDLSTGRKKQKLKYQGEIFPSFFIADKGITYLDFFQQIRFSTIKKGIVAINL
jgi:hypothetical protein